MPERSDPILEQGEAREALAEVLRAIRRNKLRVVFTTLVVLLLGVALSLLWPNKYESSTHFQLRDWYVVADAMLLEELADLPEAKKLKTLENELRSRARIEAVMSELQWLEWLETAGKESDRRDLDEKIARNLVVAMEGTLTGTHDIVLSFRWTSPRKAADFVNRLRDSWIQLTLEAYKRRLEEQKDRMEGVLADREADYHAALSAVTTYENEHNVPALLSPEVNNQLKADYEVKLAAANAELVAVAGDVQRLEAVRQAIPRETPQPRAPQTPEQADLLVKLQSVSVQLASVSDPVKGLTPVHPKRRLLQSEYDTLLGQLKAAGYDPEDGIMVNQTNPDWLAVENERQAKQLRSQELTAEVAGLKQQINDVQSRLDMLPVVTAELARLNSLVEVKSQLVSEARTEVQPLRERVLQWRAQSFGTDAEGFSGTQSGPFEILETGVEPDHPVLPITAIILAVALVVGVFLGAMGPVLTEMTRSSFGTVREVGRSLGVPVLGAVDLILTARDLRARRVQRGLTYATMALVLLSLAAAIWIYHANPEVLPDALRRTLREVRMALT